ncbi:ATP-binding protein [Thermodesulfobacteriota bacterium]
MTNSKLQSNNKSKKHKRSANSSAFSQDNHIKLAFVGGDKFTEELLRLIHDKNHLNNNIEILGLADKSPDSPAINLAKAWGIFTTTETGHLLKLPGLNMIVDLTDSKKERNKILEELPEGVSYLDRMGIGLLNNVTLKTGTKPDGNDNSKIEEENRKRHQQLILDSLPYRVMLVNDDMTISSVNKTFALQKGLPYSEIIGKHCHEVRYGLDRPCSECGKPCYFEEVKNRRETISTIHEYENEDGETRYEVITVSPILDEKGEIVKVLETSRDVTDRIALEKEVQKTSIFLRNVIESTVDGIVVVDKKGNVLIFNKGMERLTGYTAEEIMEHGHISNFYDIDTARQNMKIMRSKKQGPLGKLNPTSMSIKTKDREEIPVTLSASIIFIDGQEIGSVGVFTDMRELLQMKKDLEDAHIQLVQTEKVASVGRMAAGVAHEINNPLSGILIYSELLKEKFTDNTEISKDLNEIIDQTLRCKKIVADLLEFSRQSIGKASSFGLEFLINKCLDLLIHQALFHDIEVKKDIQPDMPELVGDMGQLQQVFTNLFVNAADAMNGKGTLLIKVTFDNDKKTFIIDVSDTGPGIPPELREKIFDIFFTTKPVGRGTGLGLSISQNIINLHNGTIRVKSAPKGGTTFKIELPKEALESSIEEPVFI